MLLVLAMLAIASGGVAFKKFPQDLQEKPLLASMVSRFPGTSSDTNKWRYQTTLILLLPIALIQIYRMKPDERRALRDVKLWVLVFIGGVTVSLWSGTFPFIFDRIRNLGCRFKLY